MKREINILWIEDDMKASVRNFQDEVRKIISDALYEVNIFNADKMKCVNLNDDYCGEMILKNKRIDLIFSDNNLGGEEGVDFITNYRLEGHFKYYILYSNIDEDQIVNKITKRLSAIKQVHLFSNFDFISLNNWKERIDNAMEAFLNNRSKMQELRNIYIVENAIIEDKLRNCKIKGDYNLQINEYCDKYSIKTHIKNLWHLVRKDRNALAHGTVSFENGENIVKHKEVTISEKDFSDKLKQLKKLTDDLKSSEISLL